MQVSTLVSFNGQCAEAFKFYEQCLGGKIAFMATYGETPGADQVPADWRGKIIHATMKLDGAVLMGCDAPPGRYDAPKGFSITLGLSDLAQAERIFKALAENGKVSMPMQKTFWAVGFGMLTDQFGIPWMINCGQRA